MLVFYLYMYRVDEQHDSYCWNFEEKFGTKIVGTASCYKTKLLVDIQGYV